LKFLENTNNHPLRLPNHPLRRLNHLQRPTPQHQNLPEKPNVLFVRTKIPNVEDQHVVPVTVTLVFVNVLMDGLVAHVLTQREKKLVAPTVSELL